MCLLQILRKNFSTGQLSPSFQPFGAECQKREESEQIEEDGSTSFMQDLLHQKTAFRWESPLSAVL